MKVQLLSGIFFPCIIKLSQAIILRNNMTSYGSYSTYLQVTNNDDAYWRPVGEISGTSFTESIRLKVIHLLLESPHTRGGETI